MPTLGETYKTYLEDLLNKENKDKIKIYDYCDKQDFEKLWDGNGGDKGNIIIIVWDGRDDFCKEDENRNLLLPHLTPMDWALAFSLEQLSKNESPKPAVHIVDLTGKEHAVDEWSMWMRDSLLAEMPWVSLYAPLVPTDDNGQPLPFRREYSEILGFNKSRFAVFGGKVNKALLHLNRGKLAFHQDIQNHPKDWNGDEERLKKLVGQWLATIQSGKHDHHSISQIIGPILLSNTISDESLKATKKKTSKEFILDKAFKKSLEWKRILIKAKDNSTGPIDTGDVTLILIDDNAEKGEIDWVDIVCGWVKLFNMYGVSREETVEVGYKKCDLTIKGYRGLAPNSPPSTRLYYATAEKGSEYGCVSPIIKELYDTLETQRVATGLNEREYHALNRKLEFKAKKEILLFDLYLFPDSPKKEKEYFKKVIEVKKGFLNSRSDSLEEELNEVKEELDKVATELSRHKQSLEEGYRSNQEKREVEAKIAESTEDHEQLTQREESIELKKDKFSCKNEKINDDLDSLCQTLRQEQALNEDDYFECLTLLPRLIAELNPFIPIIIFSSTRKRGIIQKFEPYDNIITCFEKPQFWGYQNSDASQIIKNNFKDALEQARYFIKVKDTISKLQILKENMRPYKDQHVALYIDETGNPYFENNCNKYVVGGIMVSADSWSDIFDLNCKLRDKILYDDKTNNRKSNLGYFIEASGNQSVDFEVIKLVCEKNSTKEIGEALDISMRSHLLELFLYEVIRGFASFSIFMGTRAKGNEQLDEAWNNFKEAKKRYRQANAANRRWTKEILDQAKEQLDGVRDDALGEADALSYQAGLGYHPSSYQTYLSDTDTPTLISQMIAAVRGTDETHLSTHRSSKRLTGARLLYEKRDRKGHVVSTDWVGPIEGRVEREGGFIKKDTREAGCEDARIKIRTILTQFPGAFRNAILEFFSSAILTPLNIQDPKDVILFPHPLHYIADAILYPGNPSKSPPVLATVDAVRGTASASIWKKLKNPRYQETYNPELKIFIRASRFIAREKYFEAFREVVMNPEIVKNFTEQNAMRKLICTRLSYCFGQMSNKEIYHLVADFRARELASS